MARELGDFIPLDNDPGKGRLVREDENDASDDEDDDEKRRIVFSVKEKSQRQKIAEEIGNVSSLVEKLQCFKCCSMVINIFHIYVRKSRF